MTGRAAGYCAGYSVPGYMNPVPGRGWVAYGRGRGGGRGWRNWYYATGMPGWQRAAYGYPAFGMGAYPYPPEPTVDEEKSMLKEEAQMLKQQLEDIQDRISTLEKAQGSEKKKK
jgi:hypothetical protein